MSITSGGTPTQGDRRGPPPDSRDPRANLLLRTLEPRELRAGDRVLLGIPYDGGIPSRPGARFGPRALRDALASFGTFDGEHDLLDDDVRVADLGDIGVMPMNAERTHRRVSEHARSVFDAKLRPIFVGGDHGITGSLIRGLAAARPELRLALVTIDAHLDVREYEDEASISSGTPFRRALETRILAGERTAMIGLRRFANSVYYTRWAREQGIRMYTVDEVAERGVAAVAAAALEQVAAEADGVYLSIDIDAADAAVAPGVSAMGIGGLSAREMIELVRAVAAHPKLLALDLMELSPPYDPDGRTARLAARLLLEALAASPGR